VDVSKEKQNLEVKIAWSLEMNEKSLCAVQITQNIQRMVNSVFCGFSEILLYKYGKKQATSPDR
jgi:hypothetical protein